MLVRGTEFLLDPSVVVRKPQALPLVRLPSGANWALKRIRFCCDCLGISQALADEEGGAGLSSPKVEVVRKRFDEMDLRAAKPELSEWRFQVS